MTLIHESLSRHNAVGCEARFASQLTRMLDETANRLPAGVEERLRVAREQAVARARREPQAVSVAMPLGGGVIGGFGGVWRLRAAVLLPVAALVAGLLTIEQLHRDDQINAAVEIDSGLLTDDAPLAAYRDAGFVEFLKLPAN